jgi:hypothetical protein
VEALVADIKRRAEILANWDDISSWSRNGWRELDRLTGAGSP